jgi:phosphoribosylformylglycinamidine synthase
VKRYGHLTKIADRERSPMYEVGVVTNDHRFTSNQNYRFKTYGLRFGRLFRKFTKTIMNDKQLLEIIVIQNITQRNSNLFRASLQLEAVACKDWLTNKVDRCVGGKVAKQQCVDRYNYL